MPPVRPARSTPAPEPRPRAARTSASAIAEQRQHDQRARRPVGHADSPPDRSPTRRTAPAPRAPAPSPAPRAATPSSFAVIAPTIIPGVEDSAALVRFYDDAYTHAPDAARRIRALARAGSARQGRSRGRTVRAGRRLRGRASGGRAWGGRGFVQNARCRLRRRRAAVRAAPPRLRRTRCPGWRSPRRPSRSRAHGRRSTRSSSTTGCTCPPPTAHTSSASSHTCSSTSPIPPALLSEVARACRAVVVEVPLEANWSARRAGKREHAAEVGHLQRLDRARCARSSRAPACRSPPSSRTRCRWRCTASSPSRSRGARGGERQVGGARGVSPARAGPRAAARSQCTTRVVPGAGS